MINKVILVGNVGRDPEVRNLENGAKVARFSVATNENYRDKSGEWQTITEWHNVVAWRFNADRVESSVRKGTLVYVEGKLSTRKYQDKDGNERYTTEVVANAVRILEKRDADGPAGGASFPTTPPIQQSTGTTDTKPSEVNKLEEDDLPF